MTAHECLEHPWLKGDHSSRTLEISTLRYLRMRDRIRARYPNWESFVLPLGRLAEYSCLRKLLVEKYRIHDFSFGKINLNIMNLNKVELTISFFIIFLKD